MTYIMKTTPLMPFEPLKPNLFSIYQIVQLQALAILLAAYLLQSQTLEFLQKILPAYGMNLSISTRQ